MSTMDPTISSRKYCPLNKRRTRKGGSKRSERENANEKGSGLRRRGRRGSVREVLRAALRNGRRQLTTRTTS
jgi:hypothetical protein